MEAHENRKKSPGKYPEEIRKQAIDLFISSLHEYGTRVKTAKHICGLLGIGTTETVLSWVRQSEVDGGERDGLTSNQIGKIRRLKRENAELKRTNGIPRAASVFFRGRARPATEQIVGFIDLYRPHKEKNGLMWRVEPICKVLTVYYGVSVSPSCCYDFRDRGPSARTERDKRLKARILAIYEDNYSCYGLRKIWHSLLDEGESVARCTVARLMRELSIKGAVRGKIKRTTISVAGAVPADDLVRRNFGASGPDSLWVADFTYVSTWEGWCYTALVTGVFARRLLGYCVSTRMGKEMVASAYKMAVHARAREGRGDFSGLIHHNDKGSQYTANDFAELLCTHGVRLSIGSVGDSYDNALAESMNGSYKTELVKRFGPWEDYRGLNKATAEWAHWFNESRISERNGYRGPKEVEKAWYDGKVDIREVSGNRK
jgi:putative transposase